MWSFWKKIEKLLCGGANQNNLLSIKIVGVQLSSKRRKYEKKAIELK
jgi:hypothetical protein